MRRSRARLAEHLKEGLTAKEVHVERGGDALAAIEGAAKKIEAVYATPFLGQFLHGADELHGRVRPSAARCGR